MDKENFLAGYNHQSNGTFEVEPWATGSGINSKESTPTPQAEGGISFQIDGQYAIEKIVYEAKYDYCVEWAIANTPGKWIASTSDADISVQGGIFNVEIEKLPAGQGKVTITMYKFNDEKPELAYPEETSAPSLGGSPFAQYYSVQNARYDIPIQRYPAYKVTDPPVTLITCPDALIVELWESGTDAELKRRLGYMYEGDEYVIDPQSFTGKYILKLLEGKESVMRFYPVVTRTSLWWTKCLPFEETPPEYEQGSNAQRLGYICNPLKYASLGTDWVKIQDDLEGEGPILTRTECWMASEAWDVNMYGWGTDRWRWGSEIIAEEAEPDPPPEP